MATVITIIIAILVFGLVVMIHELGHFICAKKAGIQVNEFSIGMGPALFKTIRNGTQYSVRALPIGGYVSMEGEDEELEEDSESEDFSEMGEQPEDAELSQEGASLNLQNEEIEECVFKPESRGLPFPKVKVWKRIIVVAAGAVMNLILGFVVLVLMFTFGQMGASKTVGLVEENSPIQQAGLAVGDEIVAVNGRHCFIANDIIYELQRTEGQTADLTVKRNGELIEMKDVQFSVVQNGENATMNIGFKVYSLEKTAKNIITQAAGYTAFYARLVFRSIGDLITGHVSVNELSGPVGIVNAIGQAASMGLSELLSLLTFLTVNLGIFNLLPIPALDGGKLVFLALEGIFRRPVPKKFEIFVNAAGMIFLFGLMIFATFNDITRLF